MTELRDQAAHAATVIIILGIFSIGGPVAGAVSGLGIGLLAEIKEEGNPVTWPKVVSACGSWLDLTFYAATGCILGVLL